MQKTLSSWWLSLLFFFFFVEGKTKEAFCFFNVFCVHTCTLFLENEEKTNGKKIQRNVFLSICSSHATN